MTFLSLRLISLADQHLLPTRKEELIADEINSGYSNHETVEFKVLRGKMDESTRIQILNFSNYSLWYLCI